MFTKSRTSVFCLFMVAIASTLISQSEVFAGTFKRTRTMDLKYAWGTTSLAQFDMYDQMYPGYFPIAELTFQPDGSFTAVDTSTGSTGFGIYDKSGRNLEITIVSPQYSGVVQYVGRKVGSGTFEGEILVDGVCQGHWRGSF